ncbi:MAG: DUF4402 domain-containing protein [Alphaproteobacteria bacterium]|nr:DUF4402 domain-containing protein [Alphaproteobacteria bacterium]
MRGTFVKKGKKEKSHNLLKTGLISLSCFGLHALRGVIASTATLPITVRLVRAIELTVSTSLSFGTLAMTLDRAGQARIDTSLNQLVIDNNSSLALAGGTPRVGRFTVKGAAFPVTVSIEDTAVKLTNGVTAVTVNNFNILTANGGNKITITPQIGQNSFTVPVGASLVTKPGQLTGTYVGSTRIFANFQ